jgi:hypothetical protein
MKPLWSRKCHAPKKKPRSLWTPRLGEISGNNPA